MQKDDIHERAAGVFAPDTLLPGQYFDRIRRRSDLTGEQAMMTAVLEMAIDDYMKHAGATDRLRQGIFAEVERWIESTDRSWLYSFGTICDHLALDVDYMRRGLRDWRQRALERAHGAVSDDAQASPTPLDAADEAPAPERRRAGNE